MRKRFNNMFTNLYAIQLAVCDNFVYDDANAFLSHKELTRLDVSLLKDVFVFKSPATLSYGQCRHRVQKKKKRIKNGYSSVCSVWRTGGQ